MNLNATTKEELEQKLSGAKSKIALLIGFMGMLFVLCIYAIMTTDNNSSFIAMLVVPLALSTSIPKKYREIKSIKTELESRK